MYLYFHDWNNYFHERHFFYFFLLKILLCHLVLKHLNNHFWLNLMIPARIWLNSTSKIFNEKQIGFINSTIRILEIQDHDNLPRSFLWDCCSLDLKCPTKVNVLKMSRVIIWELVQDLRDESYSGGVVHTCTLRALEAKAGASHSCT